jgi:hypothetical protein
MSIVLTEHKVTLCSTLNVDSTTRATSVLYERRVRRRWAVLLSVLGLLSFQLYSLRSWPHSLSATAYHDAPDDPEAVWKTVGDNSHIRWYKQE